MTNQRRKRTRAKSRRKEEHAAKSALWDASRSGSHAGRGFHYQDRIATELTLEHLDSGSPFSVIPEGLEDISLETSAGAVHVQAKSRREHRGDFAASEVKGVFANLAKRLAADPGSKVVLVVERPVSDWSSVGLDGQRPVTGYNPSLDAEIRRMVTSELAGVGVETDVFLEALTIEVRAGSPELGLRHLASRLDLPPASCHAHYLALKDELSHLADANGARTVGDALSLASSDVVQLLDRVSERVDPAALVAPVREGICEVVDFRTSVDDLRFYDGVDALPGHIVAGLAVERSELTGEVLDAARERRAAMVVGPSGSGKSALLWLAAWESRQEITWYRVLRLRREDVIKVVRFARGACPTSRAPLGFIVDDLGREQTEGWDELLRELQTLEHAHLIGACREEDLLEVPIAPSVAQVRPRLDEPLAARIYDELRARAATSWQGWREPFMTSAGLLLEFGHILTAGERLAETIQKQIDERRRGGASREPELEVLRLVATAHAFGADLDANRVRDDLGLSSAAVQRALARLLEEHLIAERQDGRLSGLHAIRSSAICEELHRIPPWRIEASAADVVRLLEPAPLQSFLSQFFGPEREVGPVLDALAARIASTPDASILAASLHALRVAGFVRTAGAWAEVMFEDEVAPMHGELLSALALTEAEIDFLPQPIQTAAQRMREEPVHDLRSELLVRIDDSTLNASFETSEPAQAAALLAALTATQREPKPEALVEMLRLASLDDIRLVLEAACELSADLASDVARGLGGSEDLLARLEEHLPWVREARLVRGENGQTEVAADYAAVAESVQNDTHADVVELCRYLLALVPGAAVAHSRALDATGAPAGFGSPIAEKAIPRANLPSRAAVAWNRSKGRALTRAISAKSTTDRLAQERDILSQAANVVGAAGRAYLTGQRGQIEEALAGAAVLELTAQFLLPAPETAEVAGPLDFGSEGMNDAVGFLAVTIPNNLVRRLFEGDTSVRLFIPQLLKQVDELSDVRRWSLLEDQSDASVVQLRRDLADLLDVLTAVDVHGSGELQQLRSLARRGGGRPLRRAAEHVRKSVAQRLRRQSTELEQRLASAGFRARATSRPTELESVYWPRAETLLLVEVASLHEWLADLERLVDLVRPLLDGQPPFYLAPVRNGVVVLASSVTVIGGTAFPTFHGIGDWPESPPPLTENASLLYRNCVGAITEASSIVASLRYSEGPGARGVVMHDAEEAALDAAVQRARLARGEFENLCVLDPDDEILAEAHHLLIEFAVAVGRELEARDQGGPPWTGLAAEVMDGLRGNPSDRYFQDLNATIALFEWDLEPAGAMDRFNAGIARVEERSS